MRQIQNCPTVCSGSGKPKLVVGSAGGTKITTAVAQVCIGKIVSKDCPDCEICSTLF